MHYISKELVCQQNSTFNRIMYDIAKEKTKEYYNLPITQKKFPQLSHEERLKKQLEYL